MIDIIDDTENIGPSLTVHRHSVRPHHWHQSTTLFHRSQLTSSQAHSTYKHL